MNAREFYTTIVNGQITEEAKAYAQEAITKLDTRNATRKSTKATKQNAENAPIKAQILDYITVEGAKVASELAKMLGATTQKANAMCMQMVADGLLIAGERKVKGQRAVKEYSLPPVIPTEVEPFEDIDTDTDEAEGE